MIYLQIFLTFLKIGAFTFGGGYAMLPLMKQEVLLHNWMSEESLVNFIAVAESTPGPVAINMATYIGVETGGLLGAAIATFGVDKCDYSCYNTVSWRERSGATIE